jgi:hypothetical protein
MARGNAVKLGNVKEGDELLTLDDGGRLVSTTVTNVLRREVDVWVRAKIAGTTYYMTPEHPLFTTRGLVEASKLRVGDEVLHVEAKQQVLSHKRTVNNPMHNGASVAKRLRHVNYKQIGRAIAQTIAKQKADGTYVPAYHKLPKHRQEALRAQASKRQRGTANTNYNPDSPHRNFADLKKRVRLGGYKCSMCSSTKRMEVHHADHNPNNLVVVCKSCHTKIHQKWKNFPWYKQRELDVRNGMRVERVQLVDRMSHYPSRRPGPLPVVNLTCQPYPTYLADSMWSHNCDTFFNKGEWLGVDTLLNMVAGPYPKANLLVITGGEPTLQPNLTGFLNKAVKKFHKVQVESNGIKSLEMPSQVHLVVSPKCSEKDGKPTRYLKPNKDVLECVDTFKFVLSGDPDSPYHSVPDWAFTWQDYTGGSIYVSPITEYSRYPDRAYMVEGSLGERSMAEKVSFWQPGLLDMDKMRRNHEHAARYCMEHGTYLTMQMQLFASIP